MFIAYVVVSSVLALGCLVFGALKVTKGAGMVEQMRLLGVDSKHLPVLGALLILGAIGLVVGNWVGIIGIAAGVALALYFVGAVITHLRSNDLKNTPPAAVFGVVAVAAVVLRLLSL